MFGTSIIKKKPIEDKENYILREDLINHRNSIKKGEFFPKHTWIKTRKGKK